MSPYTMRVPRKCNAKCYQNRLVPVPNKNIVSVFQENLPHFCKEFVNYHMLVHITEEEKFPVLE